VSARDQLLPLALAQILPEKIAQNGCGALELADRFYGEVAASPEPGDQVDLADCGHFSLRGGFVSGPRHWIKRAQHH
jgi:hypothetical protein